MGSQPSGYPCVLGTKMRTLSSGGIRPEQQFLEGQYIWVEEKLGGKTRVIICRAKRDGLGCGDSKHWKEPVRKWRLQLTDGFFAACGWGPEGGAQRAREQTGSSLLGQLERISEVVELRERRRVWDLLVLQWHDNGSCRIDCRLGTGQWAPWS